MTPSGLFYFWGERALYIGPDVESTLHAHHAVQASIALSGVIRLRAGSRTPWRRHHGVVIASGQPHHTDPPVPLVATFWLEPDTPEARRLAGSPTDPAIRPIARARIGRIALPLLACWREGWDRGRAEALMDETWRELAPHPGPSAPVDPRIARALDILRAAPDHRVRLADVAAGVALSPSRLAHLLGPAIGMPARRYLLWLRLRDAVGELAHGASMTEAAHAAGFADSAHLSRTFRRMLGFPPSAMRPVSKFVQAPAEGAR